MESADVNRSRWKFGLGRIGGGRHTGIGRDLGCHDRLSAKTATAVGNPSLSRGQYATRESFRKGSPMSPALRIMGTADEGAS